MIPTTAFVFSLAAAGFGADPADSLAPMTCGRLGDVLVFELKIPMADLGDARPEDVFARPIVDEGATKKMGGAAIFLLFTDAADLRGEPARAEELQPPGTPSPEEMRKFEELNKLYMRQADLQGQIRAIDELKRKPDTAPEVAAALEKQSQNLARESEEVKGAIEASNRAVSRFRETSEPPLRKLANEHQVLLDGNRNIDRAIAGIEDAKKLPTVDAALRVELEKQIEAKRNEKVALDKEITAKVAEMDRIRRGARSEAGGEPMELSIRGRYRGSGSARFELTAIPSLRGEPKSLGAIVVRLEPDPPEDVPLVKSWALGYARALAGEIAAARRGADAGFQRHTLRRLADRFDLQPGAYESGAREDPRAEMMERGDEDRSVDLYSIATGALAIEESLQVGVRLRAQEASGEETVAIERLSGPEIRSHPFEEMLGGRRPAIEKTAALVPEDAWYLHFSSITAQIRLADLLDQWGTSFLQSIEVSSRDRRLKEKILDQLAIELSTLTRLFGELVIGEVALSGSDLFLHDGSALAIILEVKNRPIFEAQMARLRAEAQKRRPDARESAAEHRGVEIQSFGTADRRVSSHLADLGGFRVYSNSLAYLKRAIDAQTGRVHSLAGARDFAYMRTIFPAGRAEEDGFFYLSDRFIREVVGPRQKIGRMRQLECLARLRSVQFGALARALETGPGSGSGSGSGSGGAAATLDALLKDGFVGELRCPGGGKYSIEARGDHPEAVCSVHNRLLVATPLIEIPLATVGEAEAQGYRQFVESYNRYWSRFFDPIGIKLRLPADRSGRIEAETCILPLIENSIYNGLREFLGGPPGVLPEPTGPRAIGGIAIKLPEREKLFALFEDAFSVRDRDVYPRGLSDLVDQFTGGIALCAHDGDLLFTFSDDLMREMPFLRGGLDGDAFFAGFLLSAVTLPVSLQVEVKDAAAARAALEDFLDGFSVRKRRRWSSDFEVETISAGTHQGIPVSLTTLTFFFIKFHLYHAFIGNRLVVATQRWPLLEAIDGAARKAAEKDSPARQAAPEPANLALQIEPRSFQRLRAAVGATWQEKMRHACFANFPARRPLLDLALLRGRPLGEEGLHYFGAEPFCPSGGIYSRDAVRGEPRCSIHQGPRDPAQPLEARGDEPSIRFLESLRRVRVDFRFTEEGVRTKVVIE